MAIGNPINRNSASRRNAKLRGSVVQPSGMRLEYVGKSPVEAVLQTPPAALEVLWPKVGRSKNLGLNRLHYADNLPVLTSLLDDAAVAGKVRLVYIDPPFATQTAFHSRKLAHAYHDDLEGHEFIEFLRKRLIILRELLADDGSIYVHIDDKMLFYVKVIMDEIFGSDNYRNCITRKKCNPKNYTRNQYGNVSDYILFYTKSDQYVWNRSLEEWTLERAAKEYQYIEASTGRRYKKVPVHAPEVRRGETGKPWRGMSPPPGKHWQFPPSVLDQMDARGEIYWSPNGNPRRKVYFDQSLGIPVQDIWMEFRDAHNQNIRITGYPTEKNPALLKRIIEASSRPGDLVLDCFSGSGTTLAVASTLGRNWIGVDNSAEAIRTTLARFVTGTEPMGDFVGLRNGQQDTDDEDIAPLPLFEGEPVQKKRLASSHDVITDFVMLAEKECWSEIRDAVEKWQRDVQDYVALKNIRPRQT